ncbi:hypothetical protein FE257_007563 [Aspergillus nanangensis]|uniref:Zn(2)-C6 fungal-type domain-containing protein n=1 Tax=Aspergillus nanangensis TaxID=2582783 RepID=A0AAD4CMH2_ASPNN|nr:hypothetical protein FE257_007563 [Aspergillus nanangensis]
MAQQGPSRPLRPIAPRMAPDPPAPGPPADEGKIKRASAACGECKRRRTKCSADTTGSPCTECALHGRECVIDEFADKRRKVAAKRAQEDLKYYRGFVEELLEAIQIGHRESVEAIIDVIRSGASHEQIRTVISNSLGRDMKAGKRKAADLDGSIVTARSTPDGTMSSQTPDGVASGRTPDGWT